MKQFLTLIWSIVLIILLFFIFKNLIVRKNISHFNEPHRNKEIFCKNKLDSLLKNNDYILLTIAFGDCSVCDIFQSNTIPDNYPVARYYIDATYHNNNMLVLQSLYFTGFPLSYIIDQNYDIIGCIQGLAHLGERMDSIIYGQYKLQPYLIPNIPKDNTYSVLSNSFKSLLFYFQSNDKDMKKFAEKSLSKGNFFFNNYLMYAYYKKNSQSDSTDYYRDKILKNITDWNAFIYQNLLSEIAPNHSILQNRQCEHTHKSSP